MRILIYATVILLVMATMCMKQNVGLAKDGDTKTGLKIAEVIRAVQEDLGFDKIQTLRFELEFQGDIRWHWTTKIFFKRPQHLKKEAWVYNKEGKLTSRSLEITDGVNLQKVILDVHGRPMRFYPMSLLKAQKGYQWGTHPLFEFIELNPEFYSKIEKGVLNETKVYILRSEKIEGLSLECWITEPPHRIVKFLVSGVANNPLFQVTDFKYKEIGQGIWYPTSYVIENLKEKVPPRRVSASNFEVNIDIPNETFMFLPEKAEAKEETNNRSEAE